MTADHASARVRQVPLGVQAFIFLLLTQGLRNYALVSDGPVGGLEIRHLLVLLILISPFILARVPYVIRCLPSVFLRKESRIDLHPGGLVYYFDNVKRPLIVEWPDLYAIERRGNGLVLRIRHQANVTEAMPKFQAEFWRAKISKPIRFDWVDAFQTAASAEACLRVAARKGVRVSGFDRLAPSSQRRVKEA